AQISPQLGQPGALQRLLLHDPTAPLDPSLGAEQRKRRTASTLGSATCQLLHPDLLQRQLRLAEAAQQRRCTAPARAPSPHSAARRPERAVATDRDANPTAVSPV